MSENEERNIIMEEYYRQYKGKISFAGSKHGVVKLAQDIISNSRPNPRKLVVIEGIWAIKKILVENLQVEQFIVCPELCMSTEAKTVIGAMIQYADNSFLVSKKVFEKMGEKENPDGLLALCRLPIYTLDDIKLDKNMVITVLDGLEIPGNIGTVIRSSEGAGANAVFICNKRARLSHPKLVKSSQGSIFSFPIVELEINDLIQWFNQHNFKIFLADTRAIKSYWEYNYDGRIAIISGSERYGISKIWYTINHEKIMIPMHGKCDSLNVGIASSILVYEASLSQKNLIKRCL